MIIIKLSLSAFSHFSPCFPQHVNSPAISFSPPPPPHHRRSFSLLRHHRLRYGPFHCPPLTPIKLWPQKLYPKRLVSIITSQQNLDFFLQIFDHVGKFYPNLQHNYDTYHAIINMLTRIRAFELMETLLAQLQQSDSKCGENLFIVVIRNYGIASRPKQALQTFLQVKEFGVETSVRSFNTLLNALIQNKQYKLVLVLFEHCKKKFNIIPNVFTYNILLKGLCKNNDIEGTLKVLDEMPTMGMVPNVVSYTTMLGVMCLGVI